MKKIKEYIILAICALSFAAIGIVFEEELRGIKYFFWAKFSEEYNQHKTIIEPYFDEQFYLSKYGEVVKKSGLKAIDHFLQHGWQSNDWRNHTDPNPWFNTTLYKERLWGKKQKEGRQSKLDLVKIEDSPFVDFLQQPSLSKHNEMVAIYAQPDELGRAWLAVEGFLRLNKFAITLHVPEGINDKNLTRFKPQIWRGLQVVNDNHDNKSFYHSDFIKNPSGYGLIELTPQSQVICDVPVTYIKQDFEYLMHRLYNYTGWYRVGQINPMLINFAHYCDEPLVFARFGDKILLFRKFLNNILNTSWADKWKYPRFSAQDFKDYMVRIADGFDLCLLSAKLPIKNLKIVPGFLHSGINEFELEETKKFEVSYLLSLGGANFTSYRKRAELNYNLRKSVWDHEKYFKVPTQFYLSFRDKAKFPEDLQNRVMPTDSKKWIYNSQFSIAIENYIDDDWFSEKLLGCFASLSVPIYIGCPNILDYFDARGMIIVHSLQEMIEAINSLTPETYKKMLPYLKENHERSLKFLNLEKELIAEFFKNKVS